MTSLYLVNFETSTNEDLREDFELTDEGCRPLDLTGARLRMTFLPKNMTLGQGAAASLLVTTENGKIVIDEDPATGRFSLAVPASDMATLTPGLWEHDLLIVKTDPASTVRLWKGDLRITPGITPAVLG